MANQYEKDPLVNTMRGNIDLEKGRVKYAKTALDLDMIEKKFKSLKDEIVILKGGSSKLENMDVDIEPPFVDGILVEPILDQFQSLQLSLCTEEIGPLKHVRILKTR